MKFRDLIKLIEADGWVHVRTTGSHMHFKHSKKPGVVTIPAGGKENRDVAPRHTAVNPPTGRTPIMSPMQYTVVLEPADDGTISVWVPDLPGCTSTGDTQEEALANIAEAIKGHIDVLRDHGEPVPPPRSVATVVKAA